MKIQVLAGGSDQIALINELKKRGHEIVLVDYFDNPPAKNYADKHIVASTLDVNAVKKIAQRENVDIITTACTDQALLTVANVSEQLNLPCYISYQTGLNVTNKAYMKKILLGNNIPTAKYIILNNENIDAVKDFVFPVIVKPVDCNSSKGVKKVNNIQELLKYLKEALILSRTKTAIVEEFKEGKEVSVDYYVEGTEAKYLSATTSLKIKNKNAFTILCSDYPSLNKEQEDIVKKIGVKVAKAFNLKDCPLFIQMIINNNEVNVIEFSARMGGGSKYYLINKLSGVNIMSKYVDLILGEKPSVNPTKQLNFCKMVYVYCHPGIFDHVNGLKELKDRGIVDAYFEYKTKGMKITHAETSGDRPVGYLIVADTSDELIQKLHYVDSHIQVISNKGDDIMIHNLLE